MRYMKSQIKTGIFLLVVLMSSFLSGCASNSGGPPMENLPPLSNFVGDYRDIEIHSDMKYDNKKSMIVRTESFTGGVFYFSGKVQRDSLKSFVLSSMQKNKWKRAGEVSYDNVLLAFTKPNKTCTVVLEEGFGGSYGYTYATIYVAEEIKGGSGGN